MHSPRVCKYCEQKTMEFITYEGLAFCDTDCLVDWVREELSRPTTGAVDSATPILTNVSQPTYLISGDGSQVIPPSH